jgi:hypothetical protein
MKLPNFSQDFLTCRFIRLSMDLSFENAMDHALSKTDCPSLFFMDRFSNCDDDNDRSFRELPDRSVEAIIDKLRCLGF